MEIKYIDNETKQEYFFYYRYYIESKDEGFIVSENDYEANPSLLHGGFPREDFYPLGTFFITCIKILSEIQILLELGNMDESSEAIIETIEDHFSGKYEDKEEFNALEAFLYLTFNYILRCANGKDELARINNLMHFITACSRDLYMCDQKYLDILLTRLQINIPQGFRVSFSMFSEKEHKQEVIEDYSAMLNLISDYVERYNEFIKTSKRIGLKMNYYNVNKSFIYYKITDIVDFILISFQLLFKNKKKIKICEHCSQYFIPEKRSDEKYCKSLSPRKTGRTCKEQEKLDRQLNREHSNEYFKVHKRIRTKLSKRRYYNNLSDEEFARRDNTYNCFLEESHKIKSEVTKEKTYFEGLYIDWMNKFYKDRYLIDEYGYTEDTLKTVQDIHKIDFKKLHNERWKEQHERIEK